MSLLMGSLHAARDGLIRAYDATIEGWARALDLRDEEAEGHSRRVTAMTIRLARAMGVPGQGLADVVRGALLHDIGKMGVPDAILFKPGGLSEREREVMRRHAAYALELLRPIEFLRPAIEIPYCHHERWDGSGYPRGLRGEEIPASARIFAAVDIWDALGNDRPYRPAWPASRVRSHLAGLAGTHLDPRVVAAFLRLLAGDEEGEGPTGGPKQVGRRLGPPARPAAPRRGIGPGLTSGGDGPVVPPIATGPAPGRTRDARRPPSPLEMPRPGRAARVQGP